MIRKQLVDLINSGEAIAVVGSGVSIDAGVPSWPRLFWTIEETLSDEGFNTKKAAAEARKGRLPQAFDQLAQITTVADIHQRVSSAITEVNLPGEHHKRLADWPFRLHVTTNYDCLLETASNGRLVTVGNLGSEVHKLSGSPRGVVWHIHGAAGQSPDLNHLVVSQSDYDHFYPSHNVVEMLKALLTTRQCVFIGFGFKDEDFVRVIDTVGRVSHDGRPAYAFLGHDEPQAKATEFQERLRTSYNVEVIPYYASGDNHSDLHRVLDSYAPFIVRESISFGQSTAIPAYDRRATSLKIQSCLDISEVANLDTGVKSTLLGARVLAHARENPGGTDDDLVSLYSQGQLTETEVLGCVTALREKGILTPPPPVDLTSTYQEKTETLAAQLDLSRDKFAASLTARLTASDNQFDEAAKGRIVGLVQRFLEDLCRERGLGVAQNLASSDVNQASRRTVALIQQLPEYLSSCESRNEGLGAIELASGVLTRPTDPEANYLGVLCQAYFGQHLVGASITLSQIDLDLLGNCCFILDASVLVCLLAEHGDAHFFTTELIQGLRDAGAVLATTDLFVEETAEHARWAARLVYQYGEQSQNVIAALRCQSGYRPNQFLRGYFLGSADDNSFAGYLCRIFGTDSGTEISNDVVAAKLETLGIQPLAFSEWEGFDQTYYAKRLEVQSEVNNRRAQLHTLKHDRQTKAEAEVAIVVDGIRIGALQPPNGAATDSFFVSSTRVVDQLPDLDRRICILPQGLAQWLWSSQPTSEHHSELVFEQLLWELTQGGIEFVDRSAILKRFSGVIEAAEGELQTAIRDRRAYLLEQYGPNPENAFKDADPLDFPRIADEVSREALARMEKEVEDAKTREREARSAAKLGDKDRAELARLKAAEKDRQRKAKKRARSAQSRKGRRKRKKKK